VLRVVLYSYVPGYENIADTGFESVCDALATGCLLAMAMPRLVRMEWFNRLLLSPVFPVLFAAIFIANKERDHPKFFWLLCVPFMNVGLALTILRYVQAPFLPLGRLLNRQPLVFVGALSYSLYLWQQLFLIQSRPVTSVFVTFPLNILTAFACAAASYYFVESPFLRLKHRFEAGPSRSTFSALPRSAACATIDPFSPPNNSESTCQTPQHPQLSKPPVSSCAARARTT
jgi:peptidoglycan/LPS O-acetylase OafA/YrhL